MLKWAYSLLASARLPAQIAVRPKIVGVSHYAIFGHEYEKSVEYYKEFLGFQEPYSLKNSEEQYMPNGWTARE